MKKGNGTTKAGTLNPARRTSAAGKTSSVFSDEEKAEMREVAKERKAEASKEAGEKAALAAIAKMKDPDRVMAKRLHAVIKTNAPSLWPNTWYGMPAYASPGKDGKVICFFQDTGKFRARYSTFGFQPAANLDDGGMWATSFALKELDTSDEAKICSLVKKAVS